MRGRVVKQHPLKNPETLPAVVDAMLRERDDARARLNGLAVMFCEEGDAMVARITKVDYEALVEEIASWE